MKHQKVIEEINRLKEFFQATCFNFSISDNFYRTDICQICGTCCKKIKCFKIFVWKDYLHLSKEEKKHIKHYIFSTIDNKSLMIYYVPDVLPCPFLKDNKCSIHNHKPVQCQIPPIKFKVRYDSYLSPLTTITKQKMGRAKQFGCNLQLINKYDEQTANNDIKTLTHLDEVATVFGYKTKIRGIIEQIKQKVNK